MPTISKEQGESLVALARRAIRGYLEKGTVINAPKGGVLSEKRGVFCTLKTYPLKVLRGCIGLPYPVKPLADAVVEAAISSAAGDPRFKSLSLEELGETTIEITVLTKPEMLKPPNESFPSQIDVGRHGLIVESGASSGLLLPQVPEEAGWKTAEEFLAGTCWKAGLPEDAWKKAGTNVYRFEGRIFSEFSPNGKIA